jgi:hypothetical protein
MEEYERLASDVSEIKGTSKKRGTSFISALEMFLTSLNNIVSY